MSVDVEAEAVVAAVVSLCVEVVEEFGLSVAECNDHAVDRVLQGRAGLILHIVQHEVIVTLLKGIQEVRATLGSLRLRHVALMLWPWHRCKLVPDTEVTAEEAHEAQHGLYISVEYCREPPCSTTAAALSKTLLTTTRRS